MVIFFCFGIRQVIAQSLLIYRVVTQSGFYYFLDFVRILKISQDICDKVVIFAESHDKVKIL